MRKCSPLVWNITTIADSIYSPINRSGVITIIGRNIYGIVSCTKTVDIYPAIVCTAEVAIG